MQFFPIDLLHIEYKDVQGPCRGDPRILLTQRTRRRIARVFKGLFIVELLARCQLEKALMRHVNLAAHLQIRNRAAQLQRHGPDRPQIFSDVLSHQAVPAGGTAHKEAVAILQGNGQPIKFWLHNIDRITHDLAHPAVKVHQLFLGKGVVQAFHGDLMFHLFKGVQGRAAHALGGRIGMNPLRMVVFQLLQLPVQHIVFIIIDLRGVLHIVFLVMIVDLCDQLLHLLLYRLFFHGVFSFFCASIFHAPAVKEAAGVSRPAAVFD